MYPKVGKAPFYHCKISKKYIYRYLNLKQPVSAHTVLFLSHNGDSTYTCLQQALVTGGNG